MKTWIKGIVFFAGVLIVIMGALFVFLTLGVQYGDTYTKQSHPSFSSAAKYVIKRVLHEVKNGIYHEATIHNPDGDTIPDWWDDAIIGKLRRIF